MESHLEIEDLCEIRLYLGQLSIENLPTRVLFTPDLYVDLHGVSGAMGRYHDMVVPVRAQYPSCHHAVSPAGRSRKVKRGLNITRAQVRVGQ